MRILDFLFGRTPRNDDPAPEISVRISVGTATAWTADFESDSTLTDEAPYEAPRGGSTSTNFRPPLPVLNTEPLFCMIRYTDADGNVSDRRITIRQIKEHNGRYYLSGTCHERRAPRMFRTDRIAFVYNKDGEAFDVTVFVRDFIGFDISENQPDTRTVERRVIRTPFLDFLRPALTLLVAAMRSDRHVHPEETDAILLYVEREASTLVRNNQISDFPTIADLDALKPRVATMRPLQSDVAEAMLSILEWDEPAFDRIGRALCSVVYADGRIAEEEKAFAEDLKALRRQDPQARFRHLRPWLTITEADLMDR